jgi:hypothetical protein
MWQPVFFQKILAAKQRDRDLREQLAPYLAEIEAKLNRFDKMVADAGLTWDHPQLREIQSWLVLMPPEELIRLLGEILTDEKQLDERLEELSHRMDEAAVRVRARGSV